MKRFLIVMAAAAVIGALAFLPTGCRLFGTNPGGPDVAGAPATSTVPASPAAVGTARVSFSIVLPNSQPGTAIPVMGIDQSPLPGVTAAVATTPLAVTFKLILVNKGNVTQPTTTLRKTVSVDASGNALATFSAIPALTCIGDLHIDGGSIASNGDFHGETDLLSGADNIIEIAPKGSLFIPDLLAGALNRIIASPTAFALIGPGLAAKVRGGLHFLASSSVDPYSDAVSIYLGILASMPTFTPNQTGFIVEVARPSPKRSVFRPANSPTLI